MSARASSAKSKPKGAKKGKDDSATGSKPGTAQATGGDASVDLSARVAQLQAELDQERAQRNLFQLEKDKVAGYWELTQQQLASVRAQLLLKDQAAEQLEAAHRDEIKVYKQKVKHLLYEYQHNLGQVHLEAEKQVDAHDAERQLDTDELKQLVRRLKIELKEMELAQQEVVKSLRLDSERELVAMRVEFDRRCKELYTKYAAKTKAMREEIELRRKSEYHQLEERKSAQIHALLKSHEKSFSEIKNYYNDITVNNLALINSLKEQVEEARKKEERNERHMAEISAENKRLKEPLDAAVAQGEQLRRQLKNYEKDKMALKNSKARLKVSEEQARQLEWQNQILVQRFKEIEKERDDLYAEFTNKCLDVQQRASLKTALLDRKVATIRNELDKRDIQLNDVVSVLTRKAEQAAAAASTAGPDSHSTADDFFALPDIGINEIQDRAAKVLAEKTDQTEKMRLELHKVTRMFNDLKRQTAGADVA